MKKYKVRVYRDGGWFRKYVEEFEIKANGFNSYKGVITFYKQGKTACDINIVIAEFTADKYTIIEV